MMNDRQEVLLSDKMHPTYIRIGKRFYRLFIDSLLTIINDCVTVLVQ